MKKILYIILIIFIIASCSQGLKDDKDDNVKLIVESDDLKSLKFWTADTIVNTNPVLVSLMDTLYQYIRSGEFPSENILQDVEWMNTYREQLVDYYCRNHNINTYGWIYRDIDSVIVVDEMTKYDMADSVIAEARRLWALNSDDSTMGMVIDNDIECTRLISEQFNEFSRLSDKCKKDEQRKMLINEFIAWFKLREYISQIFANFTKMHFYGGSIIGPIKTAGVLEIWQAHIDLYRKEYDMFESFKDGGTLINPAKRLLLDCCNEAFVFYSDNNEYYEEEYFKKIAGETKTLLKCLPQTVDNWIEARKLWEEEMCTDWLRYAYQRNTSEVLIKYANLVSSVQ